MSERKIQLTPKNITHLFDYYYDQGSKRSLVDMSNNLDIPFDELQNIAQAYAWQQKIDAKDEEELYRIELNYQERARGIRNTLTDQLEALLRQMNASSIGLPFEIKDASDLRSLAQAYECLVRANSVVLNQRTKDTSNEKLSTWHDLLEAVESTENDDR